ncbi:MAG: PPE domain-containing protein [Mycolicibacterium sp.]|nr:PPE domain-containing protein [Mycolicibacterium sp.]
MPGEWGAYPPEKNSAGFWFGSGAGTFFDSAATLEALVALLASILGGTEAAVGAQTVSWESLSSLIALTAHLPYQAWMVESIGQLLAASAAIQACAEGFESSKAATPTPGEIAENQAENVALCQANIPALGALTPAIAANRAEYARKWITAATNMYNYEGLSASTVQAIPPLAPPMPSATPAAAGDPVQTGSPPLQQALAANGNPTQGMDTLMPLLGQLVSAPSQLLQMGGGSQLLSGLTQLPQQAMQPLQEIMSQAGTAGNGLDALGAADPAAGAWITATPAAGGSVSAALSGGGAGVGGFGGGFGGGGISSVAAGLRGPASWSSTVAAAPSTPESAATSRIAEARVASGSPMSTSMGSSGAMMGPLAAAAHGDNKEQSKPPEVLLAAAQLYRAPAGVPVVTGGGGAEFAAGEEEL